MTYPTSPEVSEQLVSLKEYQRHMDFAWPERNPWRAEHFTALLTTLGAKQPAVTPQEVVDLKGCYENPLRSYHGEPHGNFMGQAYVPDALAERLSPGARKWAGAAQALRGKWHDAVYKQVDALPDSETGEGAWSPYITSLIGDFAYYKKTEVDGRPVFRTFLTDAGKRDMATTMMVAHVFGFDQETLKEGIVHNEGGNEFDSALAAAKFLESKDTPFEVVVAIVAGIAATVPFKPARGEEMGDTPDGHIGELAQRVESVLRKGDERAWADTNDIMLLAVELANRDISPFILPEHFAKIIDGGRKVRKEEVPELRVKLTTMRQLARAAGVERSAPLLYQWIGNGGPVPAENVPHFYVPRDDEGRPELLEQTYPPKPVYEQAVLYAERNSRLAALFFQAHEAGIALAASIATMCGEPDAEVPGFVHAEAWRREVEPILPVGRVMTPDEQAVYGALMRGDGQGQIDDVTSVRSPISGMLFGVMGAEKIRELSERIKYLRQARMRVGDSDPFSNHPQVAEAYVNMVFDQIGMANFSLIIKELIHVAERFADQDKRYARVANLKELLLYYGTIYSNEELLPDDSD